MKNLTKSQTDEFLSLFPLNSRKWVKKFKRFLKSVKDPDAVLANYNYPMLEHALFRGDITAVELLLNKGADPNFKRLDEKTILIKCIEDDEFRLNSSVLELCIQSGLNINEMDSEGKTALIYAAKRGRRSDIGPLLANGADINIQDHNGKSALMFAASLTYDGTVKALLKGRPNLELKDKDGYTVIFYAINNFKVNSALIHAGVNVNAANVKGNTVLFYNYKNERIITELLKSGADPNIKNKKGETPLLWMIKNEHRNSELLYIYKEHNADFYITDSKGHNYHYYATHGDTASKTIERDLELLGIHSNPFWLEFKTKRICPECAQEVPLNGPFKNVKCTFCQSVFNVQDYITEKLARFNQNKIVPACPYCENTLDVNFKNVTEAKSLKCAHCAKTIFVFPASEWYTQSINQGLKPTIIINASGINDSTGESSQESQPIAIRCISCAAALHVDAETPRNAKCEHCGTVQYLPDPLWLSLHPMKKMMKWYVYYAK